MNILDQRNQLNQFGITLHSRIVGILVDRIEAAIADGRIRTENGKHSIFDFIREILGQKSEREVWKRLCDNDPQTVTICDGLKFDRKNDRKGNIESPATDTVGLLYIAYQASCDFSQQLRSASAAHFAADRQIPMLEVEPQQPIAQTSTVELPANLAGKTQAEIVQLASDYLQVREIAAKQMPTLITILDHLADPSSVQEATDWFTAKSWLHSNGYSLKMNPRQKRHFYRAIADCHRFLTIAQPQKHSGINYYNNLHHTLLLACADNTVKLVRPTIPFV